MGLDLTGLGSIADLAGNIIDKIWPPGADPNLKEQTRLELEKMISLRENVIIEAQRAIIVAEMQQQDKFTKRARPMLVYAGLFFIFLVNVAFPFVTYFTKETLPALQLPDDFWWAWGSVVGIWSIGRTLERKGAGGNLVGMITGGK